jgi:predicted amidophosphoribosyltransferase
LHATKKRERGFNQAELLAAVAAKILDCRQDGKSLRRIRATSPQFGLNRSERRQNLDGAFAGPHRTALLQGIGLCLAAPQQRKRLEGQNVIIVDDVVTSGATIYECARAAASCGARVVGALTLARARWQNNSFAKRGNEDDIEDKDKNETETETRIPELIRPNRLFQSCDP